MLAGRASPLTRTPKRGAEDAAAPRRGYNRIIFNGSPSPVPSSHSSATAGQILPPVNLVYSICARLQGTL